MKKKQLISYLCTIIIWSHVQSIAEQYQEIKLSHKIEGIRIHADQGNIKITDTKAENPFLRYKQISGEGEIKVHQSGDEIIMECINPPKGGLQVDIQAHLPENSGVDITLGKGNIEIANMGSTTIHAGTLQLNVLNIFNSLSLHFGSGLASLNYDKLPLGNSTAILNINSARGKIEASFPEAAKINFQQNKKNITSDFISSAKCMFNILFNSARGNLIIKKNNSIGETIFDSPFYKGNFGTKNKKF